MRIGMFTDYYLPIKTGVSTSVASFREQLQELGHEVYVFAPSDSIIVREEDDHIIRFPAIKGLFVENYMTSVFFPPQQIRKIEKDPVIVKDLSFIVPNELSYQKLTASLESVKDASGLVKYKLFDIYKDEEKLPKNHYSIAIRLYFEHKDSANIEESLIVIVKKFELINVKHRI